MKMKTRVKLSNDKHKKLRNSKSKLSLKVRRSNAAHMEACRRLIKKEKPKGKDYVGIVYHDKVVSIQTRVGKKLNAKGKQYVYKQAEASYNLFINRNR